MHITVKILNGKRCTISASPSSYVTDVKEQISALMSVIPENQVLLFKGKTLNDGKKLGEYNICDGDLIMLSVKKSKSDDISKLKSPVWLKLHTFLKRHFTETDAELVLKEFIKNFEKGLSALSLDDIERLATCQLQAKSS